MTIKDTVDYYIKSTWHSLSRMYNQIAAQHEISLSTALVLISLEKDGTPATKIAPLMGMEPTSLSRLLKTMEESNLIYREGDEIDKRIVRIFLTQKGSKKLKIATKVIKDFNEKVRKNVSPEELRIFIKVIEKINNLTYEFKSDNM